MSEADKKPNSRARVRREQRRSSLVEAVEAELDETGLEGATLERVGQRVGLSKGALYYYIDSRDDLLTLVLEDVLQQQREKGEGLAGEFPTPLARLRAFAHGHVSVIVNRPAGRMIVGHLELLASHQKSTRLLQQQDVYVRAIIKDAVEAGELRKITPVIASAVLFGALNTVPRTFDPNGPLSLEEVVDAVLDLLLTGWGADAE
ncbi:MAG: TetR/AcrR family transcriptional regulator [Granulosicoccus sp.]|nr:TetR/AcrR family transcriptional regulator [Granulosicoccus sp.]